MGKIFIVLVALFCISSSAKEAEYDWNGQYKYLTVASSNQQLKVKWVALVGDTYHWQLADGKKFSGSAIQVGNELPEVIKVDGKVLSSIPEFKALVICACNGKSERVPVVMDGKPHWHENKPD